MSRPVDRIEIIIAANSGMTDLYVEAGKEIVGGMLRGTRRRRQEKGDRLYILPPAKSPEKF